MSASDRASPAPWRSDFLAHVDRMGAPLFMLSSLHNQGTSGVTPRARTVVFRGLWAGLPENHRNTAPRNPAVFETDLLTIATDVRMEKASEIQQPQNEAVGGPVEAVFWAPESGTQWRIRGRAYVVGPDIDTEAGAPIRAALRPHMRRTGASSDGEADAWSWSRELTALFGNLSPGLRGTFRNPAPGKPRAETAPGPGEGLGQKVDDLNDEVARRNFLAVVVVPEEVDRVDLSNPEDHRRWNYELSGTSWKTTELWP